MTEVAKIILGDKTVECPIITGTENEKAIDISNLRASTGYITLDNGFANTGSCQSDITFIDGELGILRHRGYPIEELAEKTRFVEVAWMVIYGNLPNAEQKSQFSALLTEHANIHPDLEHHFNGFPKNAHPMAILSAMLNAVSCYHPELMNIVNEEKFLEATAKIMSKVRTIAAYSYRKARNEQYVKPSPRLKYCANFMHMMFGSSGTEYEVHPDIEKALNLFLVLHADHEQNCSTSTVRMVGSSKANLFSSVAAGVCALWGPLHGGANTAVIQMLEEIQKTGKEPAYFIEKAKQKQGGFKLMGFGHRVYKNFDPRAKILKVYVDKVLKLIEKNDPLLNIAQKMEELVLKDSYFSDRKLYPNVDFYSGILLRSIGIPVNMFPVMFAIGRTPGWIAHWREGNNDPAQKIFRPRQIYIGKNQRSLEHREPVL